MNDIDQTIGRLAGIYESAVYSKDVESFMAMYLSDVRISDLWDVWSYDGAAAWRRSVEAWFGSLGSERVIVEVAIVRTHATRELAVVEGSFTYRAVSAAGEALRSMRNRLTWVLKPAGGE